MYLNVKEEKSQQKKSSHQQNKGPVVQLMRSKWGGVELRGQGDGNDTMAISVGKVNSGNPFGHSGIYIEGCDERHDGSTGIEKKYWGQFAHFYPDHELGWREYFREVNGVAETKYTNMYFSPEENRLDTNGGDGAALAEFTPYSNKQTFEINKGACVSAQEEINKDVGNPPRYKLFGGNHVNSFNCASWSRKVMQSAGIGLNVTSIIVDLPSHIIKEAERYKNDQETSVPEERQNLVFG